MTTVENAPVVNHVGLGSGNTAHKNVETNPDLVVEETIRREEEDAMDEEIHSDDEQDHPMTEAIENQMLTAALVNSVVDAGNMRERASTDSASHVALHMLPRPSQVSEDTMHSADNVMQEIPVTQRIPSETVTVPKNGMTTPTTSSIKVETSQLEPMCVEDIPALPGEAVLEESSSSEVTTRLEDTVTQPQHVDASSSSIPNIAPVSVVPAKADPAKVKQETSPSEKAMPPPLNQAPTTAKMEASDAVKGKIQQEQMPLPPPLGHPSMPKAPAASNSTLKPAPTGLKAAPPSKPKARPPRPKKPPKAAGSSKKRKTPPQASVALNGLLPASSAVPNPLAASFHSTMLLPCPPSVAPTPEVPMNAVPCPLSSVPCPLPPETFQEKTEEAPLPVATAPPPELPPPVAPPVAERKVTINEPPVTTRSRVFSVDLDPSTFDFPEFGNHSDTDKADHGEAPNSSDLAVFQRERAFSFEFFNFAGDELLPAAPVSEETTEQLPDPAVSAPPESQQLSHPGEPILQQRPRGDSIIFDPVSFQDGGIHEKNALMKARAASIGSAADGLLLENKFTTANTGISNTSLPQPVVTPSSAPPPPVPPPMREEAVPSPDDANNDQIATLPSALSTTVVNGATQPATFQLELLNKDGRIGIYLPEARRARIARFHAKRKMRIWRKRIKYDCRKKLADSRPRIKGRFVKRSDMDDE